MKKSECSLKYFERKNTATYVSEILRFYPHSQCRNVSTYLNFHSPFSMILQDFLKSVSNSNPRDVACRRRDRTETKPRRPFEPRFP